MKTKSPSSFRIIYHILKNSNKIITCLYKKKYININVILKKICHLLLLLFFTYLFLQISINVNLSRSSVTSQYKISFTSF